MIFVDEIVDAIKWYMESNKHTFVSLAGEIGLSAHTLGSWMKKPPKFIQDSTWQKVKPILDAYEAREDSLPPLPDGTPEEQEDTSTDPMERMAAALERMAAADERRSDAHVQYCNAALNLATAQMAKMGLLKVMEDYAKIVQQ